MAKQLLATLLLMCCLSPLWAQTDPLERLWFNEEKTAKIQVSRHADGLFYGTIVWLRDPLRDGRPKTDVNNTDVAKRNNPIIGLNILTHFKKKDGNKYEDGEIYDPKNGKTYSCTITAKGDRLDVHGYIGFSFIGRSTVWTAAD